MVVNHIILVLGDLMMYIKKRENITKEKVIQRLNDMEPFTKHDGEWYLPEIPIFKNPEEYNEYVVKNYIRCGAIPKKDLIVGKVYLGDCRNSGKAKWNGKDFEFTRHKMGGSYIEHINHFEDDDNHDLFVPMELEEDN